jgi:hypothetical protein
MEEGMEDCREYDGITRDRLEELWQGMGRLGVSPPEGDEGVVEASGVKVWLSYIATEEKLKVCILERPSFIPSTLVWGQLESSLKYQT